MSEPNHLPKANHLRFSFALIFIVAIGLCIMGVQKVLQWKADDELERQRSEHVERLHRKASAAAVLQEAKNELKPRHLLQGQKAPEPPAPPTPPAAPVATVTTTEPASASTSTDVVDPLAPSTAAPVNRGATNNNSIIGTVFLLGEPPPEKVIEPLKNDTFCGKGLTNVPMTRFYVVSPTHGLGNVFVYINKSFEGRPLVMPPPQEPVLLDQVGCLYEPYVLGAMVNQPIQFKNSDSTIHNVHATPTANAEFNFAELGGQLKTKSFGKPELMLRIKCDIHPWMFAYLSVVEHPYFAVTDATGHFEIPNVPDGNYVLEAVHQKAGRQVTPVRVDHRMQPEPVSISLVVPRN